MNTIITNDRSGLGRVGSSRKHGNPHRHQLGGSWCSLLLTKNNIIFWSNVHIGETSEAEAVLQQRWNRWSSHEEEDAFFFPVDSITLQQQVLFVWWMFHIICHVTMCNAKIFPGSSSGSAEQIYLPPKARWCRKKPLYGLLKKNRRALWITHLWRRTGGKGRLKSVPASRPLTSRLERPSHSDIEVSQDMAKDFFFLGGWCHFYQLQFLPINSLFKHNEWSSKGCAQNL